MKDPIEKISLLIADDHELFRESLVLVLGNSPYFKVIAECNTPEEAVELTKQLKPRVVIMGIHLPGMNSINATRQIIHSTSNSKVLAFSTHCHAGYCRKMMNAGA